MPKIGQAPINIPQISGTIWLRFFSDLAESLKGIWGYNKRKLQYNNIIKPDISIMYNQGLISYVYILWNSGQTFNDTTILLDSRLDYKSLKCYLTLYDTTGIVSIVKVNEYTITLPNISTTGETILCGQILSNV